MIVKDEEAFLRDCLNSVSDFVDEIVIVDTGSTDGTVDIAGEYTDKIFHHPWEGSFSKARNQAMHYCTCDWILQMDADEVFNREDIPALKKIIETDEYDAVFVVLMNRIQDGWTKHYFQRIFKRGRASYQGIVHNQLVYSGPDTKTEITIFHYGYDLPASKMAAKYERSKALLLEQIESDITDAFAYANYVRILRAESKFSKAVEAGLRALEICKNEKKHNILQMIRCDVSYSLAMENRIDEAVIMAQSILKENPENLDILYLMGNIRFRQAEYYDALTYYRRYFNVKENENPDAGNKLLIVDTYAYDDKVFAHICDCHIKTGNFQDALSAIESALRLNPKNLHFNIVLAKVLLLLNRQDEALKLVDGMLIFPDPGVAFFLKLIALQREFPQIGSLQSYVKAGLEKYPDSPELLCRKGMGYSHQNPEKAMQIFLSILEGHPNNLDARLGLIRLSCRSKELHAVESHVRYLSSRTESSDVLSELSKYCFIAEKYDLAIDVLSNYLALVPDDVNVLSDIATCYAKTGNFTAAEKGYEAALAMKPDDKKIQTNLKIIRRINQ